MPGLLCYSGNETRMCDVSYFDVVICVCDESDEQTEHHIDEERHKRVEIEPTEEPHHTTLLLHHPKRVEHVVSVDKRKQTLGDHVQSPELKHQRTHHIKNIPVLFR